MIRVNRRRAVPDETAALAVLAEVRRLAPGRPVEAWTQVTLLRMAGHSRESAFKALAGRQRIGGRIYGWEHVRDLHHRGERIIAADTALETLTRWVRQMVKRPAITDIGNPARRKEACKAARRRGRRLARDPRFHET